MDITVGVFYAIVGLGLVTAVVERFAPRFSPSSLRVARFYFMHAVTAGIAGLGLLFLGAQLQALIVAPFGLGPLLFVGYLSATGRHYWPLLTAAMLLFGAFVLSFFAIASAGLLALHNGYPLPLLNVAVLWLLSIPIALFFPAMIEGDRAQFLHRTRLLWIGIIVTLLVGWVIFSQFVFYQSRKLASEGRHCVMETDLTQHRWSPVLSARKMFLENSYKGITNPYLRAKNSEGVFDHHWSFKAFGFVPDETDAFRYGLRYYKTKQTVSPCDEIKQ